MSGRLFTALVGDVKRAADMHAKYGVFFHALAQHIDVVENFDASLRGYDRYLNAFFSFDPSRRRWKERFFRNAFAFEKRSINVVQRVRTITPPVDAILQLGAMFDATWNAATIPVLVYTDNTAAITARFPAAGRHAFHPRELAQWVAQENQLYQRAAHIFVRSNKVKRSLLEDYQVAETKLSVVGGGVNFLSLPESVPAPAVRPPTVLFIGQDFYRKGGDLLLRAFSLTRMQIPTARLLLVTSEKIPSSLPMQGVTQVVIKWDRAMIEKLYQQADVFVLPARQETWGDVLLEAMSFGLPCIGVTGQAMEDIIQQDQTGYVLPPEDIESLSSHLVKLLENPEKRRAMGDRARQNVTNNFTWERVVEKIISVLETFS